MRRPGRTLRARIVWTTTIVAAVAMAAMVGTVLLVLNATATNSVDATLRDRLEAVSTTLTTGSSGTLTELETPSDVIDDTTWIFDPNGRQVDAPRAGARVRANVESLARVRKRTTFESHDRVYLAAPVHNRKSGELAAVVVVTESMAPYETTRIAVLTVLATLGLLVTAGSAAIAAWTMRRALEPVQSMASLAADWSERDLESRFDQSGGDDEIGQLGRTLNVLLDRVAGALRNEQQLTSELAHELRTPLTAIRGEAEIGLMAENDRATQDRLTRVVSLADRMGSTISSLLAIARGESRSGARTTTSALVTAALEHRPPAPDIAAEMNGVVNSEIAAPFELALRALSPLVDNAFHHARTSVSLATATHDREIDIVVSDDGAGIDDPDPESLFNSGRRHQSSDGAGLGLALSRRVARTLGGDVRVTSSAHPTSFTLTLPRH